MNRRQFVAGCGVALTATTAGCLNSLPWSDETIDTSNPEAVVESYINLREKSGDDAEAAQEQLSKVLHTAAPERLRSAQGAGSAQTSELTVTAINGINTVTRDLSAQQIRELAQLRPQQQPVLDDGTISDLESSKTALVDAAYDIKAEVEIQGQTQTFENTNRNRFLVASEENEWGIVVLKPVFNQ
jgi:hypothetical protein